MLTRSLSILATSLTLAVVAVASAQATDIPAPNVQPGACTDQTPPTSSFTSKAAKRFKRTRVLRGSASDVGCGVDKVEVSLARRVGKRCRFYTRSAKLSRRATSCGRATAFMPAKGTTRWSFKLPGKLARGKYVIRTRATDFAGNVQHARSKRLSVR